MKTAEVWRFLQSSIRNNLKDILRSSLQAFSKIYLTADDANLVFVLALHERISERVKAKNKDLGIQTEISSKQLLQISMCSQYESRVVSKH